ncbi:hypothetical protein [Sphingomonas sp. Leaf343]|uniref:hypothetical protein n=1 Tax=Sphingomonas sp. Leaf343 TaxID=1736345 RepID=UPI0007012333|nr:hypothetical protein [Sphingomonas sp. Leaf343]KQR83456.1 hypothetical protein ASG07_06935 [Sphingomonas sp. Leaf343]
MSQNSTPSAAQTAREARQLTNAFTAKLTQKSRGPDPHVRRDSYDVDDDRAKVWRKIEDGSRHAGLAWADALIQTAEEFDVVHKKHGARGPLQANGIRVLRSIVRRALDFATGRSEPELLTIMKWTGLSKNAVVGALARLREHGFLDWVRRTIRVGEKGQPGPQRKQTSNAYWFGFGRMQNKHRGVWQRFRQLLAKKLANKPPSGATPPKLLTAGSTPIRVASGELGAVLASLGAKIESASS